MKRPELFRLEVESFLRDNGEVTVFIDEIQKVPALLDEIHHLYEAFHGQVRFLLSGSSARKLKRAGANLMAGRLISLRLHPFTLDEYEQAPERFTRLGSLPGVSVDNEAPEQTLRSYVATYLKEEIQQEALVRKVDAFARFLEVAAQYHAEIVNASTIAKHSGVSSNTIHDYLSILEDTLLAWKLPGWSASTTKQLRTSPKLYLFDNGVASALRGEVAIEVIESSARFGKMFEAFLVQELFRINDYQQLDLKFSYWRTNNGIEVDIIVSRGLGRPLAAIEIKSTKTPDTKDFSSLKRFGEDYPDTPLFCLCRAPHDFKLEGVEVVSYKRISKILIELSKA